MIAPAIKPAPTPPQPRRHCTVSTLPGTAFLSASAFATGVADATVATDETPAATTAVAINLLT